MPRYVLYHLHEIVDNLEFKTVTIICLPSARLKADVARPVTLYSVAAYSYVVQNILFPTQFNIVVNYLISFICVSVRVNMLVE